MKVVYDWIKEYVGDTLPNVEKLEELLTFHAFEIDGVSDVKGATVIDVKVLPDRSSDCFSHRGIAREIATLIDTPLHHDPLRDDVLLEPKTEAIQVHIENEKACRRFTAALVTGVTIGESPMWLRTRIEALGQRSINNVVDATNYVMYALGQPLHAYDAGRLTHTDGVWKIEVRMAQEGESITTLTGDEYSLDNTVQLIVDAEKQNPIGIAGIKGGVDALVDSQTTALIVESANFDPVLTRKASQALKLQTDASKRFENNVSPTLAPYGLKAAVALICEIAGGSCGGYIDTYPNPRDNDSVTVTHTHINALLGLSLSRENIENILTRLGFLFVYEADAWTVTPPHERTDISIPADVIAEIGRVYGYEHVTALPPEPAPLREYNARHFYSEKIRNVLVSHGFSEVITSSFRKRDVITLHNALASDKGSLRSTLKENITEVLDKNMANLDLLGISDLRVFEIGTVFHKNASGDDVVEYVSLALGVRKKQQGYSPKDDVLLKEIIMELEAILGVPLMGKIEQGIFECNLSEYILKLLEPDAYDVFEKGSDATFVAYSVYPFISRDIALWVPEGHEAESVMSVIREEAGELLVRLTLFDTFTKEGKTSFAFRLVFQSMERTLTDQEVHTVMEKVTIACQNNGFTVR